MNADSKIDIHIYIADSQKLKGNQRIPSWKNNHKEDNKREIKTSTRGIQNSQKTITKMK